MREMENGDDNQEDCNEEPSPFVPDLGLPSDETVNHGQEGNSGAVSKASGGAAGGGGGGEAPLSFRRFLETASPVGQGRPDVAAGLPDFVQDHLAAAGAAAAAAAVGAATRDARDWQPTAAAAVAGTRRKAPSQAAASAGGAAALPTAQPQGLPDFLSDGPMGTLRAEEQIVDTLHRDTEMSGARHRPARSPAEPSHLRLQRLERENACLRRDVERLQQQLQRERSRTTSLQHELENNSAAAAAAAAADSVMAPPVGLERLQAEVRSLRVENAELRRRPTIHQAASQIVAAAAGAEDLISQLASGVRSLRTIAASMEAASTPDRAVSDLDLDLDRPPGASYR